MENQKSLVIIIFSKNRALQLDASLRSLQENCPDIPDCAQIVIYTSSHKRYETQYETLKELYPRVQFLQEQNFHIDLLNALRGNAYVLFFVDDNLFVKPWKLSEVITLLSEHPDALGFSLRLGKNTTFCYSFNKSQKFPSFEVISEGVLKFKWPEGDLDFAYPLEVSSSIYRVDDLLPIIEEADGILNPNLFEKTMDQSKSNFFEHMPYLLCFEQSVAFCNSANVVQSQYINWHSCDTNQTSVELMRRFDLGYRIDLTPFRGFVPTSCHQFVSFMFFHPKANFGLISANMNMKYSNTVDERTGIAESRSEVDEIIEASCQIDIDSLTDQDRDLLLNLLSLISNAYHMEIKSPWLLKLAKTIDEDRQLDLSEFAQRMAELQKYKEWVTELEMAKEWLTAKTRNELSVAYNELSLVYNSRTYQMAALFRDAKYSKFLFSLLPLRLLIFSLPLRIKQPFSIVLSKVRKYTTSWLKLAPIHASPWPKDKPLVSVIIHCLNNGKYLGETINTMVNQTWQNFEIIVLIDDVSDTDHFKNILGRLNKPQTQILRQKNCKPPSALNMAINMAQGKYVCCLQEGDRISPTYLEKCLFRLEKEGLDICGSLAQGFGDSRLIGNPKPFSLEKLLRDNCLIAASVFRKDLWKIVGGYDESMTEGHEDWELWIRLTEAGARASTIQESLYIQGNSKVNEEVNKRKKAIEYIHTKHQSYLLQPGKVFYLDMKRAFIQIQGGLDNLIPKVRTPAKRGVNILLAMPFLVIGGVDTLLSQVCQYLSGRNVHFIIITTQMPGPHDGDTTPLFEKATFEIYHLPHFLDKSEWKSFIFYLIQTKKVDFLWQVGSLFVYNLMAQLKKQFPRLKIIDFLFNKVGHTRNNRKCKTYIDLTLTENDEVKDWLLAHGETEDRVKILQSGVDLSQYLPFKDRKTIRRQLGINDDFLIGYCGRFSEEKCPEMFIKIADNFRDTKGIQFLMTGAGPLTLEIKSKIDRLNLSDKIHFFGTVPDIRPYLGSCDILVLPSKIDGRPTVVLQALAMGVPVIASDVGALSKLIKNNQNGFICSIGNVDQFVEMIKLVMSDHDLWLDCSQGARRYAENELDANKWLFEVESLLGGLALIKDKSDLSKG